MFDSSLFWFIGKLVLFNLPSPFLEVGKAMSKLSLKLTDMGFFNGNFEHIHLILIH